MRLQSLLLAGALFAASATAAMAASYTLNGDDVMIWNPAGQVRIEPASGASVTVDVNAQGRDAARLRIETSPVRGHSALRVLYPSRRIVYPALGRWSNSNTSIRDDGTWGGDRVSDVFGLRRITVKGGGDGTEAWTDLVVRVPKGQRVTVYSIAGASEIRNVDGALTWDGGSGAVQVSGARGKLKVDVGSGAVSVDHFEGDLDVDTGSGSVTVNDMRGANLRVDTGSGSVTGRNIVADDVLVDTGSGDVELMALDMHRGKLDTGSGSVEVGLLSRTPDLDIDTGSGAVRVSAPADFSARLHFETGSGRILADIPITIAEKDRGMLRGTAGNGEGRLHVDTGSGGVSLLAAARAPAPAPATDKVKRTRKS